MAITITDSAQLKIRSLLSKRQTPDDYLKIGLQGGGCSGFMYNYEFITQPDSKDKVFEFDDVKIFGENFGTFVAQEFAKVIDS